MIIDDVKAEKPPTQRTLRRFMLGVFILFAVVLSVVPLRNAVRKGSTKDYPLWINTGTRMMNGESPYYPDYRGEFPFMYPPGAAGLLGLLAPLGKIGMMIVLVTLNSAAWFVCIAGSVFLVTGARKGQHLLLYAVPWLVTIAFVWSTYLEGQVAMFLSACLIAMLVFLRKKIAWAAGAMLALAAAIKGFPICAICYLIYRKKWMATLWTIVFLALLVLILPMFFRGKAGAMADLHTWNRGMGASYTPDIIGQRKERSYTWQNNSLLAVTNRWLRPVVADRDDFRPPIYINVVDLPFKTINYIISGIALVLCLVYVVVMPLGKNRSRWTDSLEGGMLLLLVIIFSPLSFTYNNSWLILPVTAVLYFVLTVAQTQRDKIIASLWLSVVILLLLMGSKLEIFRWSRDRGSIFFADMILFFELAWLLIVSRTLPVIVEPEPSRV